MENNTQPTNEKLLLKLFQKLKNAGLTTWDFTKKKIVPLVMAGSMAFTMASCNLNKNQTDTSSNQPDSSYTDTGSNTTDSNLSTDTGTDTNGGNLTEDKLSKYSPLVQEMLKDEYYNNLLAQAKQDPTLYSSPYFDPHPYTFLEEQGHDIEKVKSGEFECRTQAFVKTEEKNNLYIGTYIENAGGYYTEYMLKYSLTDKEMEDYKTLHTEKYIQAIFLNDWISANKPCTIVSKVNVEIETHKGLEKKLNVRDNVETALETNAEDLFLIFNSFDKETGLFRVYAMKFIAESNNMSTLGRKFTDIPMKAFSNYSFDNNMIYFSTFSNGNFTVSSKPLVSSDISIYYSQTTDISNENQTIKDITSE